MTRLAAGRSTHLEPDEIAKATLELFDEGRDPSIRQLAVALNVTPSAIYHHYDSRAEIVQAAVEIVWREIIEEVTGIVGSPFEADPVEALTALGLVSRRAFIRHHSITPYMAGIPRAEELSALGLAMFASVFERFGMTGRVAGEAFHAFASFCFGNALYAASRIAADETLGSDHPTHEELESIRAASGISDTSTAETRLEVDSILDIFETNPERDEALFEAGLSRLLNEFAKV
ncbi:MAG: TetR/AcrR family transcriptional regulator [Solirubrobacterales bacterium]|nr:TetR/AcrR family transcriptional regulator [Solirubrobacterales bacterium]HMT04567.1 TetR/AcrR family transcriptional regulator [Solirubrobacterales bacterium]